MTGCIALLEKRFLLNEYYFALGTENIKKGVLRGLHFQKEFPQGKLVRVIRGTVFDVQYAKARNDPVE